MKIAVIAHAHHPIRQPFAGGMEAHTYQLVAELLRQGHSVTLFAKAGSITSATLVVIFRGDAQRGSNPLYSRGYRRAMRLIAQDKYDLIINNSLDYEPLNMHTATMPPMITIFHTPPFPNLINILKQQSIRSNRTYIAVSTFTANQWQTYCANTIHVISNGMNLRGWKTNLQGSDEPLAAWAGRITPEKGTHVAIAACLKAGVPLKFGGPIYDADYFSERIKPLLTNELITYVGHLEYTAVNTLFAEASVALVTPLWDEPFGLVAIESWASGTPVAALPNGALPSLMHDEVGSLAASDSVEDLVVAMRRALQSERLRCRLYADENFDLPTVVNTYLSLAPLSISSELPDVLWPTAQ